MPSDLDRALAGFDARLRARERQAAAQMLRVYADAWRRVQDKANQLRRRARNETGSAGLLARAAWRDEFATLLATELRQFVEMAGPLAEGMQADAVARALADARALTGLAGASEAAVAAMVRPNPAAVQALLGFAADGSPLRDLFAALTHGVPDAMAETLASGMAQGMGARAVGRELRRQFAVPLARALLIARTETHRAYNEASMQTYRANDDILEGWAWVSACDRRSCGACFAMHGSFHPLTETLDGHPGCRCKAVPKVKGVPLQMASGEERLKALPEDVQRLVLGPGKWAAWQNGALTITPTGERSVVGRVTSTRWGTMRVERSLRAITARG